MNCASLMKRQIDVISDRDAANEQANRPPKHLRVDHSSEGSTNDSCLSRYVACMVLANVGDAIGYNNGRWEFTYSGKAIHAELAEIGGLRALDVEDMRVSDDTVMHLATAEALVSGWKTLDQLGLVLAQKYVACCEDMTGRAPGAATLSSLHKIRIAEASWDTIPFNPRGGGCGAAMRAMCIGLAFPGESQRDKLIAVAVESARITHNHPTAILGAVCSALFTAYAIEGVPLVNWGRAMVLDVLPRVYSYLEGVRRDWEAYQKDLHYFESRWKKYLRFRNIWRDPQTTSDGSGAQSSPLFPATFGVVERDKFYAQLSFDGWGGSSGHDSVLIAYDALLGANGNWEEFILRGALHGGDNDSTGCIGAAWFGALYGFSGVYEINYAKVEYRKRSERVARLLFAKYGCSAVAAPEAITTAATNCGE